ncbi:hypothetical protein B0H19DRAFT_1260010 [Mycena capillaripes]|nr:hypothetical protein B0H19DRAFT_1260010 [Mycena capillaripes]
MRTRPSTTVFAPAAAANWQHPTFVLIAPPPPPPPPRCAAPLRKHECSAPKCALPHLTAPTGAFVPALAAGYAPHLLCDAEPPPPPLQTLADTNGNAPLVVAPERAFAQPLPYPPPLLLPASPCTTGGTLSAAPLTTLRSVWPMRRLPWTPSLLLGPPLPPVLHRNPARCVHVFPCCHLPTLRLCGMRTHPPPLPIASFGPAPAAGFALQPCAMRARRPPLMRTRPPLPPTLPLLSPDANAAADPDCCLLHRPYRCFCAAPGAGFRSSPYPAAGPQPQLFALPPTVAFAPLPTPGFAPAPAAAFLPPQPLPFAPPPTPDYRAAALA